MKSKLLIFALLLMGVSVGAQTVSVSISDDCSKNGVTKNFVVPSGTENGYTWVNMGLSVMWATVNIGATNPEDYGNYYAWGETAPKTNYSWSTYIWCNGSSSSLTKYCTWSSNGTVDNKTTLEPADDAAHVNWGGSWRMPTDAEWTELRTQCTWTWTTQNGVSGYRVTASNGNSIFLPATGYRGGTYLYVTGSYAYYWSSSLGSDRSRSIDAYGVDFGSGYVSSSDRRRYNGQSVRSVCP